MKRVSHIRPCLTFMLAAFLFSGCGGVKDKVEKEPFQYVVVEEKEEVKEELEESGSIWRENEGLFSDRRAKNVNDIVTIRIVESSKATRKASTSTGRSSEMEGGVDALFGIEKAFDNHRFDPKLMLGLKGSKSFEGSGSTERSGNFTGIITAIVKEVYPNGMMRIDGRRVVTVNAEDQYITISGLIRRDDISIDNTILSTKVADAVIVYSGEGIIGREQKPGWLTRFVDVIWPF